MRESSHHFPGVDAKVTVRHCIGPLSRPGRRRIPPGCEPDTAGLPSHLVLSGVNHAFCVSPVNDQVGRLLSRGTFD
jgi:hypothetical protein